MAKLLVPSQARTVLIPTRKATSSSHDERRFDPGDKGVDARAGLCNAITLNCVSCHEPH